MKKETWIQNIVTDVWFWYLIWLMIWIPYTNYLFAILYVYLLWYIDDKIVDISVDDAGNLKHFIGTLFIIWAIVIITLPFHKSLYLILMDNTVLGYLYYIVVRGGKKCL